VRQTRTHIEPAHDIVAGFLFSEAGSGGMEPQANPLCLGRIAPWCRLFRKRSIDSALIWIRNGTLFQTKYNVRIIRI